MYTNKESVFSKRRSPKSKPERRVSDVELSDRKLKILKAIIDDYIDTGIPVGSRTLSKKTGPG